MKQRLKDNLRILLKMNMDRNATTMKKSMKKPSRISTNSLKIHLRMGLKTNTSPRTLQRIFCHKNPKLDPSISLEKFTKIMRGFPKVGQSSQGVAQILNAYPGFVTKWERIL